MPNYANGKIYTIRFHNSNEIYIGSTIQPLNNRFGGHKKLHNTGSIKKLINDKYNNDWSVCYIELYENFPCNSKEELCKKEGEIIRIFKNDANYQLINKVIIGRSKNEFMKEDYYFNKDKYKKRFIEYRSNNKDKLNEQSKEWRINHKDYMKNRINCDCGGCYTYINRLSHEKTKKHQKYLMSLPEEMNSEIIG
jgi:hypothetical protein